MAKPRVFVSSTFFDLKHVRDDLDRFIRELGYEAIRYEKGEIPYGKEKSPESYSYVEVDSCDIFVTIIGGRFGSTSIDDPEYSITQLEIKRAIEKNIPTYIFVEKNVLSEFSTYELNKENEDVVYKYIDDLQVFKFIEYLHKLKRNNPITAFEGSEDITEFLRLQWSGLFQRYLSQQQRIQEIETLVEMRTITDTLHRTLNYITSESQTPEDAIKNILSVNHPVFFRLAKLTDTDYRVYFSNRGELETWLRARGWKRTTDHNLDEDSIAEWHIEPNDEYIKLTKKIFDDNGFLIPMPVDEWDDSWLVKTNVFERYASEVVDDEIPF